MLLMALYFHILYCSSLLTCNTGCLRRVQYSCTFEAKSRRHPSEPTQAEQLPAFSVPVCTVKLSSRDPC